MPLNPSPKAVRDTGSLLLVSAMSPLGSSPSFRKRGSSSGWAAQLPERALAWPSPRHGDFGPVNSKGDPEFSSAHPSVSLSHVA